MHAFHVIGSIALFVASVAAQAAPTGDVTMMWSDEKPTDATMATSMESVGMAMISQTATAAAESSMVSGMSMATATSSAVSGMGSGMNMDGMSMPMASATAEAEKEMVGSDEYLTTGDNGMTVGGATRIEGAWGMGAIMAMMGVGAALAV